MEKNVSLSREDPKRVQSEEVALRPEALREALKSSLFSQSIFLFQTIDSTNRHAKELSIRGEPEGTLVLAEQQTAGRGRKGRTWQSPARVNLLLSIVLRPPIKSDLAFVLTMILALAASDGVCDITGLRPLIKWPNDLYVGGRKLAGILTEFSVRENRVEYMVLGMGLNVNWDPDQSPDILNPATSLLCETGRVINRGKLLICILRHFDASYHLLLSSKITGFYRRWHELSMVLGREVAVETGGKILRGVVQKITREGALILRDSRGVEKVLLNGDVSLRF